MGYMQVNQQLLGTGLDLLVIIILQFKHCLNILRHGKAPENGRLLRQIAQPQPGATVYRQMRDILIVYEYIAAIHSHQPDDHVETSGFAGTVGAKQTDHFTTFQGE